MQSVITIPQLEMMSNVSLNLSSLVTQNMSYQTFPGLQIFRMA